MPLGQSRAAPVRMDVSQENMSDKTKSKSGAIVKGAKGSTGNLTTIALIMMNVTVIAGLANDVQQSFYGLSSVTFFLLGGLLFFLPTGLVAAELASGWSQRGGIFRRRFRRRVGGGQAAAQIQPRVEEVGKGIEPVFADPQAAAQPENGDQDDQYEHNTQFDTACGSGLHTSCLPYDPMIHYYKTPDRPQSID